MRARHWMLIGIGAMGLMLTVVLVASTLSPQPALKRSAKDTHSHKEPDAETVPDFSVGDLAPDFTLPDSKEVPHRLSELVKKDTVLCFTCGCAKCLDVQTYLGMLIKRLGTGAPEVISVSSMPKAREASYFRDTKLKQTIVYDRKDGPVMKQYRGHPCPRIYALRGDRTIQHIGKSPNDVESVREIGEEMATLLGFPPEGPNGPGSPPPGS